MGKMPSVGVIALRESGVSLLSLLDSAHLPSSRSLALHREPALCPRVAPLVPRVVDALIEIILHRIISVVCISQCPKLCFTKQPR